MKLLCLNDYLDVAGLKHITSAAPKRLHLDVPAWARQNCCG